MEESSERPESKDRGRAPTSGIQQQVGRGRSPVPGRARPPRSEPTESKGAKPALTEAGASAGPERDNLGSLSGTTLQTTVPSILSKPRDAMGDPGSDTDSDTAPTDNGDSDSDGNEHDDHGKKGDRRDEGDSAESEKNDSNQYGDFQKMQPFTNQASFPVSEKSIECDIFNRSLQDLVACLRRSNAGWVSIDCLGRVRVSENKESKIRTIVVVSFSEFPDQAEELRRDLQMAMKDNGIPVELIQGKVAKYVANPFGVWEPQIPLVCGSSCAPHGASGAGTVGGFIKIDGDPDPNAVYAVTNHHVVEDDDDEKEIPWVTEQNIESHLGLTEQQCEDLAGLGLDRYDRGGIHAILSCLDSLNLTLKRTYGNDRKSYLIDLAKQVLSYWNKRHTDNRIDQQRRTQMLQSIRQQLSQLQVPGQRTHHRQMYELAITENGMTNFQTHLLEDMREFLNLHCYELQILLREIRIISTEMGLESLDGIFRDVILIRRLWRNPPGFSRVIENPANGDLKFVIRSVRSLLNDTEEPPMPQEDTEKWNQQQRDLKAHRKSANRLVGTVWASSGVHYHEWKPGSPLRVKEDWALIKLFRDGGQQFQNGFRNLLRPDFPENQFTGVRELPDPIRIDVTKRGRTTDLTAGTVNGAPSIINLNGDLQSTFAIVAKPPTTQFFSAKGDSGSWIMDRTGQLVGMLWGGRKVLFLAQKKQQKVIWGDLAGYTSQRLEVEDVTYFTPASHFFKWIETSFKEGMRTLGHALPNDFGGRVRLFGQD